MEIQLWRELLHPYELAVKELEVKFNHMLEEYKTAGVYCPIERVSGRVKSVNSILEKMKKKSIPFEELEVQMEDIAGMRLICQFVDDIFKVEELIRSRSDMEVKCIKDYFTEAKPSGYRSYHLIIYYTVETMNGPKKLQVELQIRTMAMNYWATIEHDLQYKYHGNIPDYVRQRLGSAAEAIVVLEQEMSSVRSEIIDAQNSSRIQAAVIGQILNNIQNLYKVSNKREIIKIQDEFYRIYALNDLEALERFGRELDVLAESNRSQNIDATFMTFS